MATAWTTDQVLTLAPDASSVKAGKGLARDSRWANLGQSERAIWGECQGSGSRPYQARIDLEGPAFKCTCPSRKFPCKHSLGLFLLYVENPGAFPAGDPPGWVADWLSGRAERAEKKARQAAEEKPPDPEQQAKRQAARARRIEQGIEELDLWLRDLIRHGLAWVQTQPMDFWNNMAARLVDAQAPGLARNLRDMALIPATGEGWHERLLYRLARLHLLLRAWERRDQLSEEQLEDVRLAIGFPFPKEGVLAREGIQDHWVVLSQNIEEQPDGILAQRVWLWGRQSGRPALLLSFAHRMAPVFDNALPAGLMVDGELVYYPSAAPTRALFKQQQFLPPEFDGLGGHPSLEACLQDWADALGRVPWLDRYPLLLDGVRLSWDGDRWWAVDSACASLPLANRPAALWPALSVTGGRACVLFGEYDGNMLNARSLVYGGRNHPIPEAGA